ncbi:MAG: hypothetical protein Q9170_004649 [Blastenia crenularia]
MAAASPPMLPATPPGTWADFLKCDQKFGIGIRPGDCQTAGSFLPEGWDPKTYHTVRNGNEEAFTLPWEKTIGSCTITVDLEGPVAFENAQVTLVPNMIRGIAGYAISQCPGGGDMQDDYSFLTAGLGGYVTSGLNRVWDWLEAASDFMIPGSALNTPWPGRETHFVTVTVSRERSKKHRPGDTDVEVANRVLGFVRQLEDEAQTPVQRAFYQKMSGRLEAKVEEMTPDNGDISWFDPIGPRRMMEYKCDKKLDGPATLDCAKLQYQGLGQGDVEFRQGETKYFNQDTCALAISATKPMTISWHQISTAFEALSNLCLEGSFYAAKGGHAFYSGQPPDVFGRKTRKGKRDDNEISGLNALPQGARMDLWKHGNGTSLPCELAAALRQQPLSQCETV